MTLEPEEKVAGRLFRDFAQGRLNETVHKEQPHYTVLNVLAVYRHKCPARNDISTALELREVYWSSPRITVETDDDGLHRAVFFDQWAPEREVDLWQVPAGRFGFIFRRGRCNACARLAMSPSGRFVDGWERPPLAGTR